MASQRTIQDWLVTQISDILYMDPKEINIQETFTSFGLSSRDAVMLSGDLEDWLKRRLSPTLVYEYPTIKSLSIYLSKDGRSSHTSSDGGVSEIMVEDQIGNLSLEDIKVSDVTDNQPSAANLGPIKAVGGNVYPLSHGQRAMWFQHQVAPESIQNPIYKVRVVSPMDVAVMSRIFKILVRWHESLRTTFELQEGEPVQRVHEVYESFFLHEDVSSWSEDKLQRRLREEAVRPFDLENGPLFRVYIFSRSETDHIMMFASHHIIIDLWSMAIIINAMSMLYPAAINEQLDIEQFPSPHKYQYNNFIQWQEKLLSSRKGNKLWQYWSDKLNGELPILELPSDRPRPPVQTFHGSSISFMVDRDLTDKLSLMAERYGCSLFHTLVSVYNVLLYRYTGQEDLIVGSPMIGRSKAEFTGIVGYFVNPVALRTRLSGEIKFNDLMRQVRKTVLEAISRHDYPFSLLVEKLHPERDPRHLPIFQTMFVYQKTHPTYDDRLSKFALDISGLKMNVAGLEMETLSLDKPTAAFDITLMMAETTDSIGATITYNTDLFDESTIARFWGHYKMLLEGIVTDAERPVSAIPMLTDEEKSSLLVDFNNTDVQFPSDKCIHQLFEAQVVRTPDAIAVIIDDESISYAEMNRQANRLAHSLQVMGVGPDSIVGICLERSIEMIIGLLAVLKAGGAYLPIDPIYPIDRIAFMLQDAGVPVLLTLSSLRERLRTLACKILYLDKDWEISARKYAEVIYKQDMESIELDENPESEVRPENLAYVIYTSGSTGRSKGVMVQHKGLSNLVNAQTRGFNVSENSRVLQFASFSFDASVSEIFMALLTGARLVLARRETLISVPDLKTLLDDQQITTITLPPSLLSLLPADGFSSLATVISAGESCPPDIADQWSTGRDFYNAYGPTECTIGPTYYRYGDSQYDKSSEDQSASAIPIGHPIDNTQIYLLDTDLQPVPVGAPGEICIGGVGLARGYLRRPEMTAEKFIPKPFNAGYGERLYRTGDLGRFRSDGNVEFIGRADFQVKVRGFRIELGEIESFLNNHPSVKQSVVVAQGDDLANNKLAAYIVLEDGADLTVNVLREQVRKFLPEYMMPYGFKIIDAFPLNPSGKVDRKRLPEINADPSDREAAYVPPQTGLERNIASVWQDVLKIEIVGLDDNFFDLGGHSLLMTKAHMQLQELLKREFTIIDMFSHPTIRSMAQFLNHDSQDVSQLKASFGRADKQRDALKRQKVRLESLARERSGMKPFEDIKKRSAHIRRSAPERSSPTNSETQDKGGVSQNPKEDINNQ